MNKSQENTMNYEEIIKSAIEAKFEEIKKAEEAPSLDELLKAMGEDDMYKMMYKMCEKGYKKEDMKKRCMSKGMEEQKVDSMIDRAIAEHNKTLHSDKAMKKSKSVEAYVKEIKSDKKQVQDVLKEAPDEMRDDILAALREKKDMKKSDSLVATRKKQETDLGDGMAAAKQPEQDQLSDSEGATKGESRAKKEKVKDLENDPEETADEVKSPKESMKKAMSWENPQALLKANTLGRNHHFSVNEYYDEAMEKSFNQGIKDKVSAALEDMEDEDVLEFCKSFGNDLPLINDYLFTDSEEEAEDILKAKTTTRGGVRYYSDGPNAGKRVGSVRGDKASIASIDRARRKGKISAQGAKEGIKEANQRKKDKPAQDRVNSNSSASSEEYRTLRPKRVGLNPGGGGLDNVKRRAAARLGDRKEGLSSDKYEKKWLDMVFRDKEFGEQGKQTKIQYNKDGSVKNTPENKEAMENRQKEKEKFAEASRAAKQAGDKKAAELRDKQKKRDEKGSGSQASEEERISKLESQGLTRSDAQAVVQAEDLKRKRRQGGKMKKSDINDIIEKGGDRSWDQVNVDTALEAQKTQGNSKSFEEADLVSILGIDLEEAKKILG